MEAQQLTRRSKGSWLDFRGATHLFNSYVGEKSQRSKAMFYSSSISMRPGDPKIPKDNRRKNTDTANETSHMAKTQQLAGPTNEL